MDKLKVAMRLKSFPRLSETFIHNQIKYLLKSGIEIHLIVDEVSFSNIDAVYLDKNFYLHLVKPVKPFRYAWRTRFHEESRFNNFLMVSIKSLLYRRRPFLTILPKKTFDVFHCQFAVFLEEAVKFSKAGVYHFKKLFVSGRGFDVTSSFLQNQLSYTSNFQHIDLYLPVSKSLSLPFEAKGFPKNKIRVLHSGIELEKFPFSPKFISPQRKMRILSVGRLVEKKGHLFTIKAVEELLESKIDVELIIIGDGPDRNLLENYISMSRWKSKISLVGSRPHYEMPRAMNNADLFALHCVTDSHGNMEGIPNVIKEAMALGVPVVSTKHSGIGELFPYEYHEFLCDERDYNSMATNIIKLGNLTQERLNFLLRKNRDVIEKHFDIKAINNELLEIYSQADR